VLGSIIQVSPYQSMTENSQSEPDIATLAKYTVKSLLNYVLAMSLSATKQIVEANRPVEKPVERKKDPTPYIG